MRKLDRCESLQLLQTPVHSGFRRRWSTCERKLTKRERRMTLAKLSDFLQLRRQLAERAGAAEALDRTQLLVRGTTRSHEVRVVGIRKTIGTRAGRRDDGALLEH